jgi:hypothetical protein
MPIVVGGFYRSGTTLVRRLLDSHSAIHCGPEVKFLKDFRGDYLNDHLAHVRFFQTARSYELTEDELLRVFGRAFIEFHELSCARAGKRRWADKNPENVLYLKEWSSLLNNEFLLLHVVRHPLDALASLNEAEFPRAVPPRWEERIALYAAYRAAGDAFCRANPNKSLTIAYESLVNAPDQTVRRLCEFVGEAHEPAVLLKYNALERQAGIEDPKITSTDRIHTDSIGRWRRDLRTEEVETARKILSPLGWLSENDACK